MTSKEEQIAAQLNRAQGCNLVDANLAEVIADYFAFEESEASSDNDSAGVARYITGV